MIRNNKRGVASAIIGLLAIVSLLVVGIFFVVMEPISDKIYDRVAPKLDNAGAQQIITDNQAVYNNWLDGAFLLFFGALWVGSLVVGYYSDNGKIWMILGIFIMLFVLWGAGHVANYWEVVSEKDFVANSMTFPGIYFVLDNLLWVILVMMGSGYVMMAIKGGGF